MIRTAFILGAGLGTRLRPLTEECPKPLLPVGGRPLITFAMDHCLSVGVERFIVNTHHCPGAFDRAFPEGAGGDGRSSFAMSPSSSTPRGGSRTSRTCSMKTNRSSSTMATSYPTFPSGDSLRPMGWGKRGLPSPCGAGDP